jgi:hypothetical protein
MVEALRLLNQHPLVSSLQNCVRSKQDDDCITWNWSKTKDLGGGGIQFPKQADPHVNKIFIAFPGVSFQLCDIITAYGEPSHVIPYRIDWAVDRLSGTSYGLLVVYMAQGFYLNTSIEPTVAITLASDIGNQVTFFAPGMPGFDAALDDPYRWSSEDLIAWQGFQDFAMYCRQARRTAHRVCSVDVVQ